MIAFPNIGRQKIAEIIFKNDTLPPVSWSLRLFVNNIAPSVLTQLTDLIEMNTNGYTPRPVSSNYANITTHAYMFPEIIYNDVVPLKIECEAPLKTFEFTAGVPTTVYGWYLTYNNGFENFLVFAERFTNSITVSATGDQINVIATTNI